MRSLFLALSFLCFSYVSNAQCPAPLSLSQLQKIYNTKDKEDILLELGFDKHNSSDEDVNNYMKCEITVGRDNNRICTDYNEGLVLYKPNSSFSGNLIYATCNKTHYLNLKKIVKESYKNIDTDLFQNGNIKYMFIVDAKENPCGNVNYYRIAFISVK